MTPIGRPVPQSGRDEPQKEEKKGINRDKETRKREAG
jgi:hypothetical protein